MPANEFNLIPCTDVPYFFFHEPDSTIEQRCIGHLRMDFGDGEEFWATWWPHTADAYHDEVFSVEFEQLVQQLRRNLFKSRRHMYKYLADHPTPPLEGDFLRSYGYRVRTAQFDYFIRCMPEKGNYNAYIYCYLPEENPSHS